MTSETAIVNQIGLIIERQGTDDVMGLDKIMSNLTDYLQGGSWNQKKYKGKFGAMKKFLSKHSDRFEIRDNNGAIEIKRLPPPAKAPKRSKAKKQKKKQPEPTSSSALINVFILVFMITLVSMGVVIFVDTGSEVQKALQGRLREVLGLSKEEL